MATTRRYRKGGVIYCAINKKTKHRYIGLTSNLYKRKGEHYKASYKANSHNKFHQAIRQYGWGNFDWHILDSDSNEHNLAMKERRYIKKYSTLIPNGYNHTKGGETGKRRNHTEYFCLACTSNGVKIILLCALIFLVIFIFLFVAQNDYFESIV